MSVWYHMLKAMFRETQEITLGRRTLRVRMHMSESALRQLAKDHCQKEEDRHVVGPDDTITMDLDISGYHIGEEG